MIHQSSLSSPWYEYVASSQKKYEGRCYQKKVLEYKEGDTIQFKHHTDGSKPVLEVKIKQILCFPTFENALQSLNTAEILPGVQTIEEGVKIYYQYVSLKTQQEKRNLHD
jgi:ASC-1-like (ASCH) protein